MIRQRLQGGRAQIRRLAASLLVLALVVGVRPLAAQDDPLPSWKASPLKTRLLQFIRRVTATATADSVPPAARIVTFDNEGTLWAEQPVHVQLAFTVDRVPALAPRHPERKDDKDGMPAGIQRFIGLRPIAAFGNSDGDLPLLQWTAAGRGPHLMALVHHTDGEREWAYDRQSPIGRLDGPSTRPGPRAGWSSA